MQNSIDMNSEEKFALIKDKFALIKYINECPEAANTYLLVFDDFKKHMIENVLKRPTKIVLYFLFVFSSFYGSYIRIILDSNLAILLWNNVV
jgi:hypothetical protein